MRLLAGLVLAALVGILGCGGSTGDPVGDVSGTVKIDGGPLAEGVIYFGVDGKVPVGLDIRNGAYKGKVTAGKNRVQLCAYREVPPPPDTPASMATSQKMNFIPARYNTETTLEKQVLANTTQTYDFEASSQ